LMYLESMLLRLSVGGKFSPISGLTCSALSMMCDCLLARDSYRTGTLLLLKMAVSGWFGRSDTQSNSSRSACSCVMTSIGFGAREFYRICVILCIN